MSFFIPLKYRTKMFTVWLMELNEIMCVISPAPSWGPMYAKCVIMSAKIIFLYLRSQEEECGERAIARKGVFLICAFYF